MKTIIFVISVFIFSTMSAQALPKQVDLKELGLKFEIPDGWAGQANDVSIILGHESIAGIMILISNEGTTAESLKLLAEKGIQDIGVNLKPIGDFKLKGEKRIEGMYEGIFDGTQVKAFSIGLINGFGKGMNIYILTEPDKFTEQHKTEANKLAASVQFYQAKDTEETTYWKEKLIGKQIKYLSSNYDTDYSGGSTSSSTTNSIYLYEDGSCLYYYNDFANFDASGGFGHVNKNEKDEGTFLIYTDLEGTYLELTLNNGNVYEYQLTKNEKGHALLNGIRYFVTSLE